jgi:hypothetical protein
LPRTAQRILLAVTIATLASMLPSANSDSIQTWYSAYSILFLGDPYKMIGPDKVLYYNLPLIYPIHPGLLTLPLGFISAADFATAFVWISAFIFVLAATNKDWNLVPVIFSAPFFVSAYQGQWTILASAGYLVPSLAIFFTAKPSLGLALFAANPSRRTIISAVGGGLLIALIGMLMFPEWPIEWLKIVGNARHQWIPIMHLAGLLTTLALFRWRRPEARMIFFLACVPHTMLWYDTLPLLLVARTFRESLILSFMSWVPLAAQLRTGEFVPMNITQYILYGFVPSLILVLLRPNVAPDEIRSAGGLVPALLNPWAGLRRTR